jgi:cytochrome c peroxidase
VNSGMRTPHSLPILLFAVTLLLMLPVIARGGMSNGSDLNSVLFPDPAGAVQTISSAGSIDSTNPFFHQLAGNGTTCVMCHQPSDGWSLSAEHLRERFATLSQTDLVFHNVASATCPTDDISTDAARRQAYRLLLSKGLIYIARLVPANAEFTVVNMSDPYGCATTTNLSVYRRPVPATNRRFDTSIAPGTVTTPPGAITIFTYTLTTAQATSNLAGGLDENGAQGGPVALSEQPFTYGMNDPMGTFNPDVFTIFASWSLFGGSPFEERGPARQSIARGEAIFNTRPIEIEGVAGLNDVAGVTVIHGSCSTCHNTPNVGNHSSFAPMNTGVAAASRRTLDLPLYTLRNTATGETVQTSDPGQAMNSGYWADIGKSTVPDLRGLAARAPYFHNGSAAALIDVVNFYDERFGMGLTDSEKRDLVAFLSAL